MNFASYFDSTNLKPEASENDIKKLCEGAAKYNIAAVCIHPYRLALSRELLKGSGVSLCTVIGFPLGAEYRSSKKYSAEKALDEGADELDMLINIGALKDHNYKCVEGEIKDLVSLKRKKNYILKVIVETALLNKDELILLTQMVGEIGADYIKTSTGFSTRGVSLDDIDTINMYKNEKLKIKAAGGIRELDFAFKLINAGVDRLGSSSAVKLINEWEHRKNQN